MASWLGKSNRLVDGWQLSGILSLRAGVPFDVSSGISTLLSSGVITAGGLDVADGRNVGDMILGTPQHARTYFDLTAFRLPPAAHFGMVGRDTLRGPGVATLDLSLQKHIAFTEERGIRIRVDAFNLLNRANFKFPAIRNVFVSQSGVISTSTTGGVITETSTNSRQIQVSLKLLF